MVYERIILESPSVLGDITKDEFETKQKIANDMAQIEPHFLYEKLFNLNATHYLTTNYDYGFLNGVINIGLGAVNSIGAESVYSIRRKKEIVIKNDSTKYLWHIHGEIDKPATIMLGLDHYSGSVGKINNYIKGTYEFIENGKNHREKSIREKFTEDGFNNSSWIERFFISNIHVIGFTFDFSEIDLWWILNKRARMLRDTRIPGALKNKIYYYSTNIEETKKGLLQALDVQVIDFKIDEDKKNYLEYYEWFLNRYEKQQ